MRALAVLLEPVALFGWSLLGLTWLTLRHRRALGWPTAVIAALYFWVTTPLGANIMVRAVEGDPMAARECDLSDAPGTVVALAGGVSGPHPADPPISRLKQATFRRTCAAAELALTHSEVRLILSGGSGQPPVEAELMRRLALDLGVPPARILTETRSRNTAQSADFVEEILRRVGTDRVHLVTSALHMARAAETFEARGVRVCPHPVDWQQVSFDLPGALLPQITALDKSTEVIRETMGRLWYRLSGQLS